MLWEAKLVGGPFDGDRAQVDETPVSIWAMQCQKCKQEGCTVWFSEWTQGAERYAREEVDIEARTAKYVHADMSLGPHVEEEELALA